MKAIIFRNGDEKKPSTYNLYDSYLQEGWTDEDISRKVDAINKGEWGGKTRLEIVELDEVAECIAEYYSSLATLVLDDIQLIKQKIENIERVIKTTTEHRVVKE